MREQEANLVRRALDRVRQQTCVFVNHLRRNAADGGRHHRLLLPQRFRHGQSEAFAQTLLDDDRRGALQCVDLERTAPPAVPECECPDRRWRPRELPPAPRCPRDRRRRRRPPAPTGNRNSASRSDRRAPLRRILQAVEARDLREDGAPGSIPKRSSTPAMNSGSRVAILVRQRIDGGIKQILRDGELP